MKRDKLTVFLECRLSDKVSDIKTKLGKILDKNPSDIRLLSEDNMVADDQKTIQDCRFQDEGIVHLVYRDGMIRHRSRNGADSIS